MPRLDGSPSTSRGSLAGDGSTRVVFCTYHSLRSASPRRRPTTVRRNSTSPLPTRRTGRPGRFLREGPRNQGCRERSTSRSSTTTRRLHSRKRLYMTATPRHLHTALEAQSLPNAAIDVVDMGDQAVYGPELHRLPFKKAVEHEHALGLPGDRARRQRKQA